MSPTRRFRRIDERIAQQQKIHRRGVTITQGDVRQKTMLEKFTDFAETARDSAPLRLFKLIIVVSHAGSVLLP
ncbi:hypothetical protein [Rhodanobacter glycinis]|uniref:hypothetical protein n=1 Tax=Rhodanobacter glycinis TaxID=582702 RepID=UPI0011286F3D|nr:hypothetical protein [Rhodanobacter glycinis]